MRQKADFFASETLNYAFIEQQKNSAAPFWRRPPTACIRMGQQ
jgi:hypothetical protein